MQYYNFQLFITDPSYSFDQLSYDLSDIFVSLEENPLISSVDMASTGGEETSILVGTGFLTLNEVEAIMVAKFHESGRDSKNYLLFPSTS